MPKVMHINCACAGSTGKIIGDIADYAVNKGFQTLLCAPCAPGNNLNIRYVRTSFPYEQGLYRRLNRFYGFQYGFAPISTIRIKHAIKKEKPDLVHIHCVNGFMVNVYALVRLLKENHIPMVITNHAEFFYTGSCAHTYDCEKWKIGCGDCPQGAAATMCNVKDTTAAAWKKMKETWQDAENTVMVSVSPWVGGRAIQSPLVSNLPQQVIFNGVNTEIFTCYETAALRKEMNIGESTKVIFHPTANFSADPADRKGGKYILELAKQFENENAVFLVAGKYSQDLKVPQNVMLLGRIADQKLLAQYYAMADVTVIASSRETFSMPVAESLCCGTPVVGFFAGGPESIAIEQFSRFSEYADVLSLAENLRQMLNKSADKEELSACAKEKYAASRMAQEYIQIYEQLLRKEGNDS